MLPHLSRDAISLFRPDILLIEGLAPDTASSLHLSDPIILRDVQSRCTLHLLEIGYTTDASYYTSLSRKHFQHLSLCHELMHAGWTLSHSGTTPYWIILLGSSGAIFKPFREILLTLGIDDYHCLKLMRKLVIHASRFAHSIVRLRRRLEWTIPSDYYPP